LNSMLFIIGQIREDFPFRARRIIFNSRKQLKRPAS